MTTTRATASGTVASVTAFVLAALFASCLFLAACVQSTVPGPTHDASVASVKQIRAAAEKGDADAQFKLGMTYYYGYDVAQDSAQAALWFRKAAEQGNSNAQCALGVMYDTGQGVAQDDTQAAFWYHKAAVQEKAAPYPVAVGTHEKPSQTGGVHINPHAQNDLGGMDLQARVAMNCTQARAWLRKSSLAVANQVRLLASRSCPSR